jgi:hypothetical protein
MIEDASAGEFKALFLSGACEPTKVEAFRMIASSSSTSNRATL